MFNAKAFLVQHNLLSSGAELTVSRLKGGYWNDVLRVQSERFDWVLKRFHEEEERERLFPVLADSEALALKTLQNKDVAPDFVAYFPAGQGERAVLIYDFFQGDLAAKDFRAIAKLMKRYHSLAIAKKSFRPLAIQPKDLLLQANTLLDDCQQDSLVAKLQALRPQVQTVPALRKRSLIHTDAWIGNFISSDTKLALIDWQCPGMGDPAEDIWTFLYSGFEQLLGQRCFSNDEKEVFLKAYADQESIERLELLKHFFAFRVAAHCVMRFQDLAESNPEASAVYSKILKQLMDKLSYG